MRSVQFQVLSANAVSAYPWIALDHHVENFVVSYQVLRSGSGNMSYSLQGTLSNLQPEPVSAHVFDIVSNVSGSINGSFSFPVAGVRLNFTATSGSQTTHTLLLMQAGN